MTRRTRTVTETEEYETETETWTDRAADVYWEYWSIKTVFGLIGLVVRAIAESMLES